MCRNYKHPDRGIAGQNDFSTEGMYDEIMVCEREQCKSNRQEIKRLLSFIREMDSLKPKWVECEFCGTDNNCHRQDCELKQLLNE